MTWTKMCDIILLVSCQEVAIPNELRFTQENTQLMWQPHSGM